jgi:hypothetical protein
MISFRIIALVLICLVTVRENFSFALTVLSPSARYQATFKADDQHDEDDSNSPDQLPADDSELPAIVEVELSQSDLSFTDSSNASGETQVDAFSEGPCVVYVRADSLSGSLDSLDGLMKLRI